MNYYFFLKKNLHRNLIIILKFTNFSSPTTNSSKDSSDSLFGFDWILIPTLVSNVSYKIIEIRLRNSK